MMIQYESIPACLEATLRCTSENRAACFGGAHEAAPHTPKELIAALTVIEHLLTSLYVLPHEAKRIPVRTANA